MLLVVNGVRVEAGSRQHGLDLDHRCQADAWDMTDVKLRESSKLGHLDLDDLPAKVANVQTELQQLDEATQQVRQKVRQAEQASQQSHVSEQLLEQQIEQDLAIVQTLQMRQADLLALKTAQGQRPKRCNKAAVLQVSLLAVLTFTTTQPLSQILFVGQAQSSSTAAQACKCFL